MAAAMDDMAGRSLEIERWLDRELVMYDLMSVPMRAINTSKSRSNQARVQAITPERVAEYEVMLRNGATFPALVGYERPGGIVLIDGNHRHEMYLRREVQSTYIYVCDVNDEVATHLTGIANTLNGYPPTDDERLAHALNEHLSRGLSIRDAASQQGVTAARLSRWIKLANFDARTHTLGIRGAHRLSDRTRERLNAITSDPAFEAATRLILNAGALIDSTEIDELTAAIRKARSDEAALVVVGIAADKVKLLQSQRDAGITRRRSNFATPWIQAKSGLSKILNLDAKTVHKSCQNETEWKAFLKLVDQVMERLETMRDA